jgi:hypothetical protein
MAEGQGGNTQGPTSRPDTDSPDASQLPAAIASQSDSDEKKPLGFGDVARKIRGRTTDLLAIAIVLMGGLAVGNQIHVWWQDAEPGNKSPEQIAETELGDTSPWGTDQVPVSIDFGNSPHTVTRTSLAGNRKAATKKLVQQCREIAQSADRPVELPKPAHQKMLQRLAKYKPTEQKPGEWKIYQFDGPVIMATATREFPRTDKPAPAQKIAGQNGAESSPGVVCWGLAFPAGEEQWTLFTFRTADRKNQIPNNRLPKIRIPPKAHRIFSIRDERGRGWISFRGLNNNWRQFHNGWLTEQGWEIETDWIPAGNTLSATFLKQDDLTKLRAEITYQKNEQTEQSTGTIIVTPLNRRTAEKTTSK